MTWSTRGALIVLLIAAAPLAGTRAEQSQQEAESLDLPPPSDPKRFREFLQCIQGHVTVLEDALGRARQQMPEIARYLQAKNADNASLLKPETHRQVHDKYPATELFDVYKSDYRSQGFETDPSTLKERVDKHLRRLELLRGCARSLAADEPVAERCANLFYCPRTIGRDTKGFYRYDLEEGYQLGRVAVTSRESAFDAEETAGRSEAARALRGHEQDLYIDSCNMLGLMVPEFKPGYVSVRWNHEQVVKSSLETFRAVCSSPPESQPVRTRLLEVAAQFPKDDEVKAMAARADQVCVDAAKVHCNDVFRIRQAWGIAYVTRACEVRRVTKADLEDDVRRWTQASEVEKQEHLLLADRIDACQAADAAGFAWVYQEPKLPPECSKATNGKKGSSHSKTKSKAAPASREPRTPDSL